MKRLLHLIAISPLLAAFVSGFAAEATEHLVYPHAPKSSQVDDYFGTKVADPYRPLEDADSKATRKWIEAENKLTFDYLAKIPERKQIKKRLTALWNYERYGVPFREGGDYFFTKNTGLQNQSVLFVTPELPGKPRALLDPNVLSKDGTVALSGLSVPDGGKLLAYGLASAGSDWQEWKVRDIATGKDLGDDVKWGEIFRRVVESRRRQFLLQPLRRTQDRATQADQLFSQNLPAQDRHAAIAG